MRGMRAVLVAGVWCLACHVADAEAQTLGDVTPVVEVDEEAEGAPAGCEGLLPGPVGEPTGMIGVPDSHERVDMVVDGEGNVLLERINSVTESRELELRGPSGGLVTTFYDFPRQWFLIAQDRGFHLLGPRSDSDPTRVLHVMTPNGTLIPKSVDLDRVTSVIPRGGQGTLLLRSYRPSEGRWRIDVLTLDREGELSADPLFIASGAGPNPPGAYVASSQVDSALVLFDSSEAHNASQWSARWFRPEGTAVGPPFWWWRECRAGRTSVLRLC